MVHSGICLDINVLGVCGELNFLLLKGVEDLSCHLRLHLKV